MKALFSLFNDTREHRSATDLGLLIGRVMLGVVFVFHGSQKLFGAFGGPGIEGFTGFLGSLGVPLPGLNAWLAAGVEFVGGLALLLGFGVRVLGLPLVITMLVAAFTAHSGFSAQSGGMEYPLTLAALTATLTLTGPGHFSLATLLFGSTPSELSSSESSSGNRHEPALVT